MKKAMKGVVKAVKKEAEELEKKGVKESGARVLYELMKKQ